MKVQDKFLQLFFLIVIGAIVVACSPEAPTPQQIAAYPQSPGGDWVLPAQLDGGRLVYDAYLALDVRDPDSAAADANRIAQDFGGYLVNSYTSIANGNPTITLEFRIPPHNFEAARQSFRTLGTLDRETIAGEWEGGRSGWEQYAQFTLFFRRQAFSFSLPHVPTWRPGETLHRALGISVRLLGFVIDLLIWVVVILGPFALIGWIGAWVVRRLQRANTKQAPAFAVDLSSEQHENSSEIGRDTQ